MGVFLTGGGEIKEEWWEEDACGEEERGWGGERKGSMMVNGRRN